MSSDLTFITNENGRNLLDRFKVLIKDTKNFDVLVGYFFTSGFYKLYKSFENTEKIRILIGIGTDAETVRLVEAQRQQSLQFSHAEVKDKFSSAVESEMDNSEDNRITEEGVRKFLEWLHSGKLEIKAYPSKDIHAKVYIMSFKEGDRDKGRVITGSSNFSRAGFVDNLEFNVELKNRADYDYAKAKFEQLWVDAVDVSGKYIETIRNKTWLNDEITPFELYLKCLYEYFKDELNRQEDLFYKYCPVNFKRFEYQEQAVLNAKRILEEYGGVFISDVVGLGKTYISAMLASQLDGRNLVIAPPVLLDEENPGSWRNVFSDFRVHADYESRGKLDALIKRGVEKYKNIFIDEAHRFRSEDNVTYEKLAGICRGKRIILVTATPYNNTPKDILSQIKLFQNSRKSAIPGMSDLESFFSKMAKKLKGLDRQKNREEYLKISRYIAGDVREKVLKYLMVRRTRSEVEKYFENDLKKQKLRFPDVAAPRPLYYKLNEKEDEIFNKTIAVITNKLECARYKPMLYYTGGVSQPEKIGQTNMGKIMKIILIKRLESSFSAFRKSIDRFIVSNERFMKELDKGYVYVSKKHSNKIYEFLEADNDSAVEKLIDEDKAEKYSAEEFEKKLRKDLEKDIAALKEIKALWDEVRRDPKIMELKHAIKTSPVLRQNKFIIFTESKETAEYIAECLKEHKALLYTSASDVKTRGKVISNFDANAPHPEDDCRILIATEVLSEGVNLHRANTVINYDIPWNPTRLMQRVGRINRVDTKFDKVYTYNFFPTAQANTEIKLKEAAEAKIHTFITMLGADALLLTEGEPIGSHELFDKLMSAKTITGEDGAENSELKYLRIIKDLRDTNPDVFNRIKRIPKKSRSAKKHKGEEGRLLTYFKKGKLHKFYMADKGGASKELDFMTSAGIMEVKADMKKEKLGGDFYELLDKNKAEFDYAVTDDLPQMKGRGGRDSVTRILGILRAVKDYRMYTDDQENYIRQVIKRLEEGALPRQTAKTVYKELNENKDDLTPLKIIAVLRKNISGKLLDSHFVEETSGASGIREVILSEYLVEK
ncbi:MAG: helicase [Elusimicrobia bacterium HGW-Elusimicrobia-2]|nr:MAG: helicase [Elusimicrobia bacterium HGW-Elusimicrobia-2]